MLAKEARLLNYFFKIKITFIITAKMYIVENRKYKKVNTFIFLAPEITINVNFLHPFHAHAFLNQNNHTLHAILEFTFIPANAHYYFMSVNLHFMYYLVSIQN